MSSVLRSFFNSTQVPRPTQLPPITETPVLLQTPKSSRSRRHSEPQPRRHPRPTPAPTAPPRSPPRTNQSSTVQERTVIPNPSYNPNYRPTPPAQNNANAGTHLRFGTPNNSHTVVPEPPFPRIPAHETLAMLRRYDGTTDPSEFIQQYECDIAFSGHDITFCIFNFDRVLDKDAQSWYNAMMPSVRKAIHVNNEDPVRIWKQIIEDFLEFFDQKSRRGTYKQKNKALKLKKGDDPQSYVSAKLEICRNINPNMRTAEKIEKLIGGLPSDWQTNFAMQGITSHTEFLSKLRAVTDTHNRLPVETKTKNVLNPNAPDADETPKSKNELSPQLQALVARIDEIEQQRAQTREYQPRNKNRSQYQYQPRPNHEPRSNSNSYRPRQPTFSHQQGSNASIFCFNCKEQGHKKYECPHPASKDGKYYDPNYQAPAKPYFEPRSQATQGYAPRPYLAQQQNMIPVYYQPAYNYQYPVMQQMQVQPFPVQGQTGIPAPTQNPEIVQAPEN